MNTHICSWWQCLRKVWSEGIALIESILDPRPVPEEIVEQLDLHAALHQAIRQLPLRFRPIVHLRCFRQLSFAEIGRMLNMPENTVKTYFYRSLPRLRRALVSNVHFASIS